MYNKTIYDENLYVPLLPHPTKITELVLITF